MRGRFIPAYTGNSRIRSGRADVAPVHPRVHGELAIGEGVDDPIPGSSPRTRGTRDGRGRDDPAGRFIPAYTGNSSRTPKRRTSRSVHPRVHGELFSILKSKPISGGSSPRTRGTPLPEGLQPLADRFIPAYTGNSPMGQLSGRSQAVHPRVHGELGVLLRVVEGDHGSSPRTRGTPHGQNSAIRATRFIPAYTGNS